MESESVIEILQKMKNVLMQRGWVKGQLENHDTGEVCLLGAHDIALYGKPGCPFLSKTEDVLNVGARDHGYEDVPGFNNAAERTFNEILAFLDDLIISEKEKA